MKPTNNFFTVIFFFFCTLISAQNIDKLYVGMPDALNPTLTSQQRLELIEYAKAGQNDTTLNRFKKPVFLLKLDTLHQHLIVKNSGSSTFEMKIMDSGTTEPIIGIIRTVCAPICHSLIVFYDLKWNRLPVSFPYPQATDWLDGDKVQKSEEGIETFQKILKHTFVSLSFQEDGQGVIASNNSLDFLSTEDKKLITPCMNTVPLLFQWNNLKWMRAK
jgi:hypothetical protein